MGIRCRIWGGISARPADSTHETLHQFSLLKKRREWPQMARAGAAPVSRGVRSLGSTCRRVMWPTVEGAAPTPRRRPQSKQVLPCRSRSSAAQIDPLLTRKQKKWCSAAGCRRLAERPLPLWRERCAIGSAETALQSVYCSDCKLSGVPTPAGRNGNDRAGPIDPPDGGQRTWPLGQQLRGVKTTERVRRANLPTRLHERN
jgi:hypothetical protein